MKTTTLLLSLIFAFSVQAQIYQLPDVDTAPIFAKGKMTSDNFLQYYLQYPQEEYEQGLGGTVTLEYVVDSTGMVGGIVVKNSVSPAIDAEAKRVASLFPFYTPARKDGKDVGVRIQFPITFKSDKAPTGIVPTATVVNVPEDNSPKSPLYVVNDKVLQQDENINPTDIKKIRIVKGQKAIDLYGNRAKDGLILIETK